jgi:hypothetical protein
MMLNTRTAHAFTVLAYKEAQQADEYQLVQRDMVRRLRARFRDRHSERAIAFARAADEAIGLVSPS